MKTEKEISTEITDITRELERINDNPCVRHIANIREEEREIFRLAVRRNMLRWVLDV